jgi:endonuclease/exonuclease/phosphatase family metal-dependent hydrolase
VNRSPTVAIASLALVLCVSVGCGKNVSDSLDRGGAKESASAANANPEREGAYEAADQGAESPPKTEVTVATYNVNWGNRDAATTAEILRETKADVVCIQESRPEFEHALKRELAVDYPHVIFRGDGDRFPAERFGFLSKYVVRKETFLPARHGIFGAWIVEIETPINRGQAASMPHEGSSGPQGIVIQAANVHLEPIRPPEQGELPSIFAIFAEAEKIHAAEIARILEHISPSLPTIVAGDFNSLSNGAAPGLLRKAGFVDSFAAVTENPDRYSTWRWPTNWIDLTGRIDYIFHTPHFRTVESRIVERTTSDHSLVVSRLEWKQPE